MEYVILGWLCFFFGMVLGGFLNDEKALKKEKQQARKSSLHHNDFLIK